MSVFTSYGINFLLLKNSLTQNTNIIIFYSEHRYILIFIKKFNFFKKSNILLLNYNLYYTYRITDFFIHYIDNWTLFFIKKLKFKGKGFKIIKNKQKLFLSFNHSHITLMIFFNVICVKINKLKYIFLYKNYLKLIKIVKTLYNIRPINIFTKKGIRLSRQKIFKKIGKRTN